MDRLLKRKQPLLEANEQPIEPSVEDIVKSIRSGELSMEQLATGHENGEISDETFDAVKQQIEADATDEIIAKLVEKINNGEITTDDLDKSLASGEIDEDIYTSVLEQITQDPNMTSEDMPTEEPQAIVGTFNNVRLYDHFVSLKEYISTYKSAYSDIEVDQLTTFQVNRLSKLYDDILELEKNLIFYMNNTFSTADYKKNLYTYLLFNKQFADDLSKFRRVLNLNPKDLNPEEQDKQKKS